MNKILTAIAATLLLVGCSHTDPTPGGVTPVSIPALPVELSEKAVRLPDITDPTMGGQVQSGIEAEVAYNNVAFKHNKLIDLYNCVRTSINDKTDPKLCMK